MVFQIVPLPLSLQLEGGGFLRRLLFEPGLAPGGKSHKIVGVFYDWVPLEFLTNRLVHTESPASHQLQYWVSYPGAGSSGGFSFLGSAKVSCYILYLPVGLSNLGRSSLLGILTHPVDPRRVVDFQSV